MLDEWKDKDPVNSSKRNEHCAVVVVYKDGTELHIRHFSPQPDASGCYSGRKLAEGLFEFCQQRNVPLSHLAFIGSDGTPKMTGHKTGALTEFKRILKRLLQRMSCLHHHPEKTFGSIICHHSLNTTSSNTLDEPWKSLVSGNIHLADINPNFVRLSSKAVEEALAGLTDEVFQDLSDDHKILISIVHFIQTGEDKYKMIKRKIRPISMARFTTLET